MLYLTALCITIPATLLWGSYLKKRFAICCGAKKAEKNSLVLFRLCRLSAFLLPLTALALLASPISKGRALAGADGRH